MRTKVLVLSLTVAASLQLDNQVQAQATFLLRNYPEFDDINAPVFDSNGAPLEGARYLAALYGGPARDSLSPATRGGSPVYSAFFTGVTAGYFEQREAFVNEVPGFGNAWLQVRVWDTELGATYEDVVARDIGGYGESNLLYLQGGGALSVPQPLIGLESFSLRAVVPEPTTLLLGLVGVPLLVVAMQRTRPRPNAVETAADPPRRRP